MVVFDTLPAHVVFAPGMNVTLGEMGIKLRFEGSMYKNRTHFVSGLEYINRACFGLSGD